MLGIILFIILTIIFQCLLAKHGILIGKDFIEWVLLTMCFIGSYWIGKFGG